MAVMFDEMNTEKSKLFQLYSQTKLMDL